MTGKGHEGPVDEQWICCEPLNVEEYTAIRLILSNKIPLIEAETTQRERLCRADFPHCYDNFLVDDFLLLCERVKPPFLSNMSLINHLSATDPHRNHSSAAHDREAYSPSYLEQSSLPCSVRVASLPTAKCAALQFLVARGFSLDLNRLECYIL